MKGTQKIKKLWKKSLKSHYFKCNLILSVQPDNYKNQIFYPTLSIILAVFFSVLNMPKAFLSASTILAEFLSASEYAYIMLSFFQKFQPQYGYSCYAYKKKVYK